MVKKLGRYNPAGIFLWVIAGYVLLLTIANLLQSGILKGLSYVAAFCVFMLMATISAFLPRHKNIFIGFGFALFFYYYGMLGSLVFNIHNTDWASAFKMLMGPLFLIIGVKFEAESPSNIWARKNVKPLFSTLIILPFGLWLWQLIIGSASFGSTGEVSIFANRNNAALYAVTLFALYNVLSDKPIKSYPIYIFAGICFGTLGVFLAIMLAILLTMSKAYILRFAVISVAVSISTFVVWIISPEFGIFSRLTPVIDSIKYIWTGRIDLGSVTYGELVQILNTSDLSFVFRLKHWLNLLNIYVDGSIYNWFYGFGIGSSSQLSDSHLVPHNDYLRYLFECGVVTFFGFVLLIGVIIKNAGRRWESVPLFVISIYFFSENLITNFIAMTVFYFCAGVLLQRYWQDRMKKNILREIES